LSKIGKTIQKLYKSVKTSKERNESKIIYHFCSSSSFVEIIESESLWLSDLLKMNDPNEIIKNIELSKETSLNTFSNKETYEQLIRETSHDALTVFSCSFSKRKDDLNQWRSYSEDGTGVCIGFDKNRLEACLKLLHQNN
jgi:hypothetical protein